MFIKENKVNDKRNKKQKAAVSERIEKILKKQEALFVDLRLEANCAEEVREAAAPETPGQSEERRIWRHDAQRRRSLRVKTEPEPLLQRLSLALERARGNGRVDEDDLQGAEVLSENPTLLGFLHGRDLFAVLRKRARVQADLLHLHLLGG